MVYKFFLYKTSANCADAPVIGSINAAISKYSEWEWKENCTADHLLPFDTKGITQSIEAQLTDPETNCCKCKTATIFPPKPYTGAGFICVVTSYDRAHEVLPKLHAIAAENDLVLYDAERGKTFYRDLVDRHFITMRLRRKSLVHEIRQRMKPLWKIREIYSYERDGSKQCAYVVTITKDPNKSFRQRVQEFYRCLTDNLTDDEELRCEDCCYKILGPAYRITYVLEGYKKHANQMGHRDCCLRPLRRMSTETAFRWMSDCSEEETDDIFSRMNFDEMCRAYPNPADRFVASVNVTKWQRKQIFDIRYSGTGYYSSEILFHIVPDEDYRDEAHISVLKIGEESATYILPFIDDVYPDFYEHYYLEDNHLSMEAWERILNRLREARDMILNNTFSSELDPYVKSFNLFVLVQSAAEEELLRSDTRQFLCMHRYDVAELYDVFIRWSEAQFECYRVTGAGRLFNMKGP